MWPFGRKAEPVAGKGTDALPAPVIRTDWKGLPPVQRAIGEHPLTARGDLFANDLATHQDPSVVSRTLGHNVSIEAPAGLVLAVTRPGTREDGPSMVSRPRLQRKTSGASPADDDVSGLDQEPDGAPSQPSAFRELPVVDAPAAVQRLTTIAPEVTPVPIGLGREIQSRPPEVQRSASAFEDDVMLAGISPAAIDDSQAAPPTRRTLGQSRRLGLGPPLGQVPATVQRATELTLVTPRREAAAAEAAITTPEISPETASGTAAAGTQSMAGAPAVYSPTGSPLSSAAPQTQLSLARSADENPDGLPRESVPDLASARLDLPLAPASPGNSATQGMPAAQGIPGFSASAANESQAAPGTAPSIAAMGLPASLQRVISPEGAGLEDLSPRGPERPLIQRRASAGSAPADLRQTTSSHATSSSDDAGASTTNAPMSSYGFSHADAGRQLAVSRLAGPGPSSTPGSSPGLAPLAGSRALGTVQRNALAAGAPAQARTQGSGAAATAAAAAALNPANGRDGRSGLGSDSSLDAAHQVPDYEGTGPAQSKFSLQRVAASQSGPGESPLSLPLAPVASMASLQRATASVQAAVLSQAVVQRAPEPVFTSQEAFIQTESAAGSAGPAAAPAPAGGTESAGSGEEAMDALAGKLYDRIRHRLKSELLVDRERAGLLTDLR